MPTTPDKAAIGDGAAAVRARSISGATMLDEIIAHLGAARIQLIPQDDAIIAEHIRAAHDLSLMLRRAA